MFMISDFDLEARSLGRFSLNRAKRDPESELQEKIKTTLKVGQAIMIMTLIMMIMTATTSMIIQRIKI